MVPFAGSMAAGEASLVTAVGANFAAHRHIRFCLAQYRFGVTRAGAWTDPVSAWTADVVATVVGAGARNRTQLQVGGGKYRIAAEFSSVNTK